MRIAIPLAGGQLSQHFGHSEQFLLVDMDREKRAVLGRKIETAPEHAPGVLPRWLVAHGVNVLITAGLGARARDLLAENSVEVLTGITSLDPEKLLSEFFNGTLQAGDNHCDHSGHGCNHSTPQ